MGHLKKVSSSRNAARAALAVAFAASAALPAWSAGYGGADEPRTPVKRALLGSLTFSFYDEAALANYPRESEEVRSAMTDALNHYNTVARYSGNVPVSFVTWPGLTAQTGYSRPIKFGSARSARVAQHEMAHWMGLIQATWIGKARFSDLCNNGWQGVTGKARMNTFMPGAGIGCDNNNGHFWSYGLNQDRENNWLSVGRNIAMVGAMRADLGLTDGSTLPSKAYRFVNRASGQMLADKSSIEAGDVIDAISTVSSKQGWVVEFNGGYIQLRNLHSNRFLDGSGATPIMRSTLGSADGTWWEMTPTSDGHFLLRNKVSNLCLKSVGRGALGAPMQLADCQGDWNPPADLQFHLANPARPPGLPKVNTVVQLAPGNEPKMRVGVDGNLGEVIRTVPERPTAGLLMQGGSAYVVRPGLADAECISLEAYNRPGSYVHHDAREMVLLRDNDGSDAYKASATFCPTTGMSDPKLVTLRPFSSPHLVLRHAYYKLLLGGLASPNIESDATFSITPLWNEGPNAGPMGSVVLTDYRRCMVAPIAAPNMQPLQLQVLSSAGCNTDAGQRWKLTAAMELRNQSGDRCLDATGGGTSANTRLISWPCHGGKNQKWRVQLDGSIMNPNSGLCVDGYYVGLRLQACSGQASQKWRFE